MVLHSTNTRIGSRLPKRSREGAVLEFKKKREATQEI